MPPAPQRFDPSSPSLPFEFARVPHRSSTNILNFCVRATNFEVNFPMSASRGMSLYLNLGHAPLLYFAPGSLALATFAAALFFPAEEGKPPPGNWRPNSSPAPPQPTTGS